MKKTIGTYDLVNQYVADIAIFIIKLHNLHWNTTGRHFEEVHKYTEDLYVRFFEMYDEFAELLKAKNQTVFGSMADYLRISSIKEVTATKFTDTEALQIVSYDLDMLRLTIEQLIVSAAETKDYTTLDLAQKELAFLEKEQWMLKATTLV
jgi:starvation-inducible DNA-binding protein